MRGAVPNYVVVEIGKRDPSMRSLRAAWLKANYGDAEHVWLGEYGSAEAAMARAARLCPAERRCWPGEADCGPQAREPDGGTGVFRQLATARRAGDLGDPQALVVAARSVPRGKTTAMWVEAQHWFTVCYPIPVTIRVIQSSGSSGSCPLCLTPPC